MSETVRGYGFVAAMKVPLNGDAYEEFSEELYDKDAKVRINGHGVVWCDFMKDKHFSEREDIYHLTIGTPDASGESVDDFKAFLEQAGIEVDESTIKPYSCIWYTGCDSPLYDLKWSDL